MGSCEGELGAEGGGETGWDVKTTKNSEVVFKKVVSGAEGIIHWHGVCLLRFNP